ncbi:MAG: carboxymuconolactone decarboxylase family protein [Burkholderiales bacterium]|nr:carboxymuconolactone decarboxylase family protein [Burkholderiales bacterium]
MSHTARLDYHALDPKSTKALSQLSYAATSGLDRQLREIVNLRISQLNGCAFCIDMHWADLVKQGVEPRRINAVAGWREAPQFFGDRERALLAWAESVNAVPHRSPSDEEFAAMQRHFSDEQIASITFAVGAIRAWNMLNASFRTPMPEVPYSAG